MAFGLVVAVLALAYGTQSPNLAVAEFAPSADHRPEAPPTTAAPLDGGSGAARARATTTTSAPSATTTPSSVEPSATTRVSRSRTCVGNPPRQVDDPLSPPCVATIFDGENGGNTSKGVSATEVRVAVLLRGGWSGSFAAWGPAIAAYFDYFNSRFELYGRRLVPVLVEGSAADPLGARAMAQNVVDSNVFGAIQADQDWLTANSALPLGLGRGGVVTILENLGNWHADRTLFDEWHPYLWSLYPSLEDVETNLADFACSSLAGHPARHAGDPALRNQTRKFAILSIGNTLPPATRLMSDALTACTGEAPLVGEWTPASGATLRTLVTQFKSAGATTVFCVCEGVNGYNNFPSAAQASAFAPEWIVTPSTWGGNNDDERILQMQRSSGLPAPIRVTAGPKLLPTQARPWFQVLTSADAKLTDMRGGVYSGAWALAGFFYDQLLVIASGVQAAGPNLTPDTFAAGLMSTTFPNPGAGQAPYWQPSAGFGPGDHSLYDDYAIGWWSDTAEALNYPVTPGQYGSWCYVGQGARFRPGAYAPDIDAQLFDRNLPCR